MSAWEMPKNHAPVLDNFIIRDNMIRMRGGITARIAGTTALNIAGYVAGYDVTRSGSGWTWLMVGTTADGSPRGYPWQMFQNTIGSITPAASYVLDTVRDGQLIATSGSTVENVPGPRWVAFGGLLYGLSLGSATTYHDTNSTYSIPGTNLCTMQAGLTCTSTSVQAAPTVLSGAPRGAIDLAVHQNRIWLLGGVDTPGAGTVHSNTTLYFTVPGKPGVGSAAADWRDPISGLTNSITIDAPITSPGMGLGRVRNGLVVLCRNSLYVLRGTTTSSYTMTQITREVGCIDPRSIVETNEGLYFMSSSGLMLTDGISVKNVSGTLGSAFSSVRRAQQMSGGFTLGSQSEGSLLLGAGYPSETYGYLYQRSTRAWSRITTSLSARYATGASTYPKGVGMVYSPVWLDGVTFGFGSAAVLQLEDERYSTSASIVAPEAAYFHFHDVTASPVTAYGIPARWRTRYPTVVGTATRKRGQAKRFFVDGTFAVNTSSFYGTDPGYGWTVTPLNPDGSVISGVPASQYPFTTDAYIVGQQQDGLLQYNALQSPRRYPADFPTEIDDMMFEIASPGAASIASVPYASLTANGSATLQGMGVEYQPARQLS